MPLPARLPLLRALLLLLAGVVLSACGHPIKRTLVGRWIGEGVENFADDANAAATGWARGVSFEFSGSSLTLSIPAEEPRTGAYRVLGVHEQKVRLNVQDSQGRGSEVVLLLDDDDRARWILEGDRAVLLQKQ